MPSLLRMLMVVMELFFLLIGIAFTIGASWLVYKFPMATAMLAPEIAHQQTILPLVAVLCVGVAFFISSVLGIVGTVKNREIFIVYASALLAPCFAFLSTIAVFLLLYRDTAFAMVRETARFEMTNNISTGLLKTCNGNFGCCLDPLFSVCRPSSTLCKDGCEHVIWVNYVVPYLNMSVSIFGTTSAITLAGIIMGFMLFKSIGDDQKRIRREQTVQLGQLPASSNRAVKQE